MHPKGRLAKEGVKYLVLERSLGGEVVALTIRDGGVPPSKLANLIFLLHASSSNLLKLLNGHVGIDIEVVAVVDLYEEKKRW